MQTYKQRKKKPQLQLDFFSSLYIRNCFCICGSISLQVEAVIFKVARYSFSGSIPPKFERKLRRYKQRFGKINPTVVLDKDEKLL